MTGRLLRPSHVLLLALSLLGVACTTPLSRPAQRPPPRADLRVDIELAGAPARGPEDAPITIVEFGDFRCPYCRRAAPTLDRVLAQHPTEVRHVFKHFPIVSEDSGRAARAAEAAHRQGRFWDFRDELYALASRPLHERELKLRAEAIGMDPERFSADLRSPSTEQRVNQDLAEAHSLGLRGTPAFFVNGRALRGAQPFSVFEALIAEELANALP